MIDDHRSFSKVIYIQKCNPLNFFVKMKIFFYKLELVEEEFSSLRTFKLRLPNSYFYSSLKVETWPLLTLKKSQL